MKSYDVKSLCVLRNCYKVPQGDASLAAGQSEQTADSLGAER